MGSIFEEPAEWERLDAFQGVVSRSEFVQAMDGVYAPRADWRQWMTLEEGGVRVATDAAGGSYFLGFAAADPVRPPGRSGGLRGLRIVLDPGHLGGEWGPMEQRSFSVAGGAVLQEGDLTLAASKRIARRLRELGAEVFLTREAAQPVTDLRAEDLEEEAKLWLPDAEGEGLLAQRTALAERLFYRTAEIRARARRIDEWGGADLALVLHINASSPPAGEELVLSERNDAHVLVNGCYLTDELANPVQRLQLLLRLAKGYHREERASGAALVTALREGTNLPPYLYEGDNAAPLGADRYLWARNLLANRSYNCPVVYLEPWQATSEDVYEWAVAGDYEGERAFAGEWRRSLPAVYSEMVVRGLVARFE